MATKYHYDIFPPRIDISKTLNLLINEARTELGRYDGFLSSMHNSEVLLSPLFYQEAVISSKIEGTMSSLSEVLQYQAYEGKQELAQEKKDDLSEVLNYRYAMKEAVRLLQDLPLSQRVLKETHKVLMDGTRGKNKSPGEYRKIPVWVGSDKTNIANARFIPIEASQIVTAMSNVENYIHNNNEYDDLVKVAILHAEIESIHPFLDGNGRVGRLFIPLYLWQKKLISTPAFYISKYIETNKETYYDLLHNISKKNEWGIWIEFFVKGVIVQSKENLHIAKNIIQFYRDLKDEIPALSRSPYGITALDFIFKHTHFSSNQFSKKSKIPLPTAKRLLKVFTDKKLLSCIKGKGRAPNFYIFNQLIDIADGKDMYEPV